MTYGRLSRPAREVAVFTLAVALLGTIVVVGLDYSAGKLVGGRGPFLDMWDLLLAILVALGLSVVAVLLRSGGVGVFAIAFFAIAATEQFPWYEGVGRILTTQVNLAVLQGLIPASEQALAEFLMAAAVATVGIMVIVLFADLAWPFTGSRHVLIMFLVFLFGFAAGWDLLSAAWDNSWLEWVEEIGERLVLVAAVAYAAGLALDAVNTLVARCARGGSKDS